MAAASSACIADGADATTPEEVSLAEAFTSGEREVTRWVRYAQGLLIANEFVFID